MSKHTNKTCGAITTLLASAACGLTLAACSGGSDGGASDDASWSASSRYLITSADEEYPDVYGVYDDRMEMHVDACQPSEVTGWQSGLHFSKGIVGEMNTPYDGESLTRETQPNGDFIATMGGDYALRFIKLSNLRPGPEGAKLKHNDSDGEVVLCRDGTVISLNHETPIGMKLADDDPGETSSYYTSRAYRNGLRQLTWHDADKGPWTARLFDPETGRKTDWFGTKRRFSYQPGDTTDWDASGRVGVLPTANEVQDRVWVITSLPTGIATRRVDNVRPDLSKCEDAYMADDPVRWTRHESDGEVDIVFEVIESRFATDDCGTVPPRQETVSVSVPRPSELQEQVDAMEQRATCRRLEREFEEGFTETLMMSANETDDEEAYFRKVRQEIQKSMAEMAKAGCEDGVTQATALLKDFK